MKYVYWLVLTAWSVYMLVNNPNLTPKDDIYLSLLCAVSMMLSVVGFIILWVDSKNT